MNCLIKYIVIIRTCMYICIHCVAELSQKYMYICGTCIINYYVTIGMYNLQLIVTAWTY